MAARQESPYDPGYGEDVAAFRAFTGKGLRATYLWELQRYSVSLCGELVHDAVADQLTFSGLRAALAMSLKRPSRIGWSDRGGKRSASF